MGISKPKDEIKAEEKEKAKPKKEEIKKEKVKKLEGIVRILNTDLIANKNLLYGLTGITGVSYTFSKAVLAALGLDAKRKLASLTNEEIEKIEDCLKNPQKYGIPSFVYNRKRDPEIGIDRHLVGPDVKIMESFDIKKEIELKTYKGFRHTQGLPVRGQRTRSHFRRGRAVGVLRGKLKQIAQQKTEETKK